MTSIHKYLTINTPKPPTKLPGSSLWLSHFPHLTSPPSSSLLHPTFILSPPYSYSSLVFFVSAMKIANINPKNIFRSRKKSRSVSRSDPLFSDSSDYTQNHNSFEAGLKTNGSATPTSVLPTRSHEISADEWSSELCELVQAFKVIDRDGDGKITRADLGALLSRVGADPPSEEELSVMLSEVDRDGDGCIRLEEFGAMRSAFGQPACDAELREAFDFFDSDHDGKITAEELLCVLTSIGDGGCTLEDCRRMISGVDKNKDGIVCLEDFSRMMMVQQR